MRETLVRVRLSPRRCEMDRRQTGRVSSSKFGSTERSRKVEARKGGVLLSEVETTEGRERAVEAVQHPMGEHGGVGPGAQLGRLGQAEFEAFERPGGGCDERENLLLRACEVVEGEVVQVSCRRDDIWWLREVERKESAVVVVAREGECGEVGSSEGERLQLIAMEGLAGL
jgi:hypothetical protein